MENIDVYTRTMATMMKMMRFRNVQCEYTLILVAIQITQYIYIQRQTA